MKGLEGLDQLHPGGAPQHVQFQSTGTPSMNPEFIQACPTKTPVHRTYDNPLNEQRQLASWALGHDHPAVPAGQ